MARPIAFLDRDGTLIKHIPYLCDPAQVELLDSVALTLTILAERDFHLVMVSNQSGVGRGYFQTAQVEAVNQRVALLLGHHGVRLDLMLYCPHQPSDQCRCRKPNPGMVEQAQSLLGQSSLHPASLMIGDSPVDMGLAAQVGLQAFQLPNLQGDFDDCQVKAKVIKCRNWAEIQQQLSPQ